MGNSKTSKPSPTIYCKPTSPEKKFKQFILVGTGCSGKLFFNIILNSKGKSVFMEQLVAPTVSYDKYKKNLRNWFLYFFHSLSKDFLETVIEICKNDLTEEMIEMIREGYLYPPKQQEQIDLPITEILTKIHSRKDLWNELISLERGENMELFLNKCQSGEVFNPFIYSLKTTNWIRKKPFKISDESYMALTFGGQRSLRKSFIQLFDFDCHNTMLLFVSLSEFDQELFEDPTSNRMDDSLICCDQMINSRIIKNLSCEELTIFLIFTKPDILLRKLQNGIEYNRELCYEIRPELENISIDNNLKLVVNSIVNEYSTIVSKENFKYHIVNCLERNEVVEAMTRIIQDENSQDITCPFISTSLLPKACYSSLKQHFMGMYPSLTDISIMTKQKD